MSDWYLISCPECHAVFALRELPFNGVGPVEWSCPVCKKRVWPIWVATL